jgi:hypothetical protein
MVGEGFEIVVDDRNGRDVRPLVATVNADDALVAPSQAMADARLIAAVPELFDFTRLVANMIASGEQVDDDDEPFEMDADDAIETLNSLIELSRAAIAKATGATP